ncbi:MAG: PKD domain-containing protein [bacterium]
MNKETAIIVTKKTVWEKAQESFITALMSAGIVLLVLLFLWIPFKLVPAIYSNGTNLVSTSLSSLFISGDTTPTPKGTATKVNINATNNNQTVNTNTPSNSAPTYSNVPVQKTYFGKPDLQTTLIATGIIDPASKQFMQTNYAGFNDEVAMKFQVKNIGTNVSGAWKLRINTPSRTTPYYDFVNQTSIKPGDRIVYTTSFDNPLATGINTAYITADPLNMVNEDSESNNLLIVPIKIEGTFYSYNNNYNYGSNIAVPNLPYGTLYTWTSINVNCYASPQTSYVGSPVTWYATVSGGNGYYTYSWSGSDLLNANESFISKIYYSAGTKNASVTVTSNGQSVTKQCSAYIY